jgi:hypothetical protein
MISDLTYSSFSMTSGTSDGVISHLKGGSRMSHIFIFILPLSPSSQNNPDWGNYRRQGFIRCAVLELAE